MSGVLVQPQSRATSSKHAEQLQDVPHTREPASKEKPEVHPEEELHRAAQQKNMDFLDFDMTDNFLKTIWRQAKCTIYSTQW